MDRYFPYRRYAAPTPAGRGYNPIPTVPSPPASGIISPLHPSAVTPSPVPYYEDPDALQSRTLYFGRLPSDITNTKLQELCQRFGDIRKCVAHPDKHMGFVEFFDMRNAAACRDALKGYELGKRVIDVQFSIPKRIDKNANTGTLYVRPHGAERSFIDPNNLDSYKELFGKYGEIKKVSCNRKREAEKFIEYYDFRHATAAQEALNGFNFNGVSLEVQFAQNPSRSINKDVVSDYAAKRGGQGIATEGFGPIRHHHTRMWNGYGAPPAVYHQQPPVAPYDANINSMTMTTIPATSYNPQGGMQLYNAGAPANMNRYVPETYAAGAMDPQQINMYDNLGRYQQLPANSPTLYGPINPMIGQSQNVVSPWSYGNEVQAGLLEPNAAHHWSNVE